jgi:long-chain acyl-CoA synthetase
MTENAGIATANRFSLGFKPGSAGKPYFNCELRIVDNEDNPVGPGERGEIVTRGPATMKGYFGRPKDTEEVMRGGWLHTGDIGYLDEAGFVYVVDRKKDMIIRGGENIYPAELEDALFANPGIAEAAVVGIPDPVFGEKVVAFVVLRPGSTLTSEAILDDLQSRVRKFKMPQTVHLVSALPKAGVGKVLRRQLREEAKKLDENQAESAATPSPSSSTSA